MKRWLLGLTFSLLATSLQTHSVASFATESPVGNRVQFMNRALGPGKVAVQVGVTSIGGFYESTLPSPDSPNFTAVFPQCSGGNFGNCVEAVEYRSSDSESWKLGTLPAEQLPISSRISLTYTDGRQPHKAGILQENQAKGIPAGAASVLVRLPGAKHAGGDTYLVSVLYSTFPSGINQTPIDFRLELLPVNYHPNKARYTTESGILTSDAYLDYFEFPLNIEYRITTRLGVAASKISTFFAGRINAPNILIDGQKLIVSGKPETYSIAQTKTLEFSQLTQPQKNLFGNMGKYVLDGGVVQMIGFRGEQDFVDFALWEEHLSEVAKSTAWNLNSTFNPGDCKTSGLSGFISSNALIFSEGAPTWNQETKSLIYRMASTHLDSNGNVNTGNLDLALSPDLIKCLWGESSSLLSAAEVSVSEGSSDKQSITTMNLRGGWVYINVRDFTFSAPTAAIKLKFKERSVVTSKAPKFTYKCVKGKLSRAVSPKTGTCPKGYKLVKS